MAYYLITFLFLTVGILLIVKPDIKGFFEDMLDLFKKTKLYERYLSIRDQTGNDSLFKKKLVEGKKLKESDLTKEYKRIRNVMIAMGKANEFIVLMNLSLLLIPVGCFLGILVKNAFLIPVFALGFAFIPFVYASKIVSNYDKQIKQEMETALSIVTSSYIRNDDIVTAVSENLQYMKAPVKTLFSDFVIRINVINPDIVEAVKDLKSKVNDPVFEDWCDTLITSQEDRTLKDSLLSVVSGYTDVRIVNSDIKGIMTSVKTEYFAMVALVIGNIPLLKLLNKDWYLGLVNSVVGKLMLALIGIVIIVTFFLLLKYTKPVERKG